MCNLPLSGINDNNLSAQPIGYLFNVFPNWDNTRTNDNSLMGAQF